MKALYYYKTISHRLFIDRNVGPVEVILGALIIIIIIFGAVQKIKRSSFEQQNIS